MSVKSSIIGCFVLLSGAFVSFNASSQEDLELSEGKDQLSYAMGVEMVISIFQGNSDFYALDMDELIAGFGENLHDLQMTGCEQILTDFLGEDGREFNQEFLVQGSRCIGRLNASYFYQEMKELDKLDAVDLSLVQRGFSDAINGTDIQQMTSSDRAMVLKKFGDQLDEERAAQITVLDAKFWKDVLEIKGIEQVDLTGVYIETIKDGKGDFPIETSDVEVNYILMNNIGDTLQSTYELGETFVTNLMDLIEGFREGVMAMKKGGEYRIFIPYEKAYKNGNPDAPQGALVFFIELVNVGEEGALKKLRRSGQ